MAGEASATHAHSAPFRTIPHRVVPHAVLSSYVASSHAQPSLSITVTQPELILRARYPHVRSAAHVEVQNATCIEAHTAATSQVMFDLSQALPLVPAARRHAEDDEI